MTAEEERLKGIQAALGEQIKHQRVIIGLLWDIKYELQNARKMQEAAGISYKIKVKGSPLDRIKKLFSKRI